MNLVQALVNKQLKGTRINPFITSSTEPDMIGKIGLPAYVDFNDVLKEAAWVLSGDTQTDNLEVSKSLYLDGAMKTALYTNEPFSMFELAVQANNKGLTDVDGQPYGAQTMSDLIFEYSYENNLKITGLTKEEVVQRIQVYKTVGGEVPFTHPETGEPIDVNAGTKEYLESLGLETVNRILRHNAGECGPTTGSKLRNYFSARNTIHGVTGDRTDQLIVSFNQLVQADPEGVTSPYINLDNVSTRYLSGTAEQNLTIGAETFAHPLRSMAFTLLGNELTLTNQINGANMFENLPNIIAFTEVILQLIVAFLPTDLRRVKVGQVQNVMTATVADEPSEEVTKVLKEAMVGASEPEYCIRPDAIDIFIKEAYLIALEATNEEIAKLDDVAKAKHLVDFDKEFKDVSTDQANRPALFEMFLNMVSPELLSKMFTQVDSK